MLLFASTEIIKTDLKRIGSQLNSLNFRKMEYIINRMFQEFDLSIKRGRKGGGDVMRTVHGYYRWQITKHDNYFSSFTVHGK